MANPIPGWYADPAGDTTKLRYWNGDAWTDDYREAPPAAEPQVQSPQYTTTTANAYVNGQPTVVEVVQTQYAMSDTDRTLRLIAFIFNVLSMLAAAIFIIPLAWMIPMTVRSWNIYKGTRPNTVAFDVCTLLFLDLISGILLLVSKKDA